jgi:hypothetical protein
MTKVNPAVVRYSVYIFVGTCYVLALFSGILYNLIMHALKVFFFNVWRIIVFDICFTGFGTALTTILPIMFQYCYQYYYSDNRNLWVVMKVGGLAL